MNIPRSAFLQTTTAFTSVNLYTPEASSQDWRAVWFPAQRKQARPGFTLDAETKSLLEKAQGKRFTGTQTTHMIPDKPAVFNPTTGEGVYRHEKAATRLT